MRRRLDMKLMCSHCMGTGWTELTGIYARTLRLLRSQTKPVCGKELAALDGCSNAAMCNRLKAIEKFGMAKSVKDGSYRRWTAT